MSDEPNGVTPETPAAPTPPSSYAAYPTDGRPSPLPPPSTTKATVALVLAIVPILFTWIAALVLAIQVLADSRDGRNHGKGRAIAALVIVGVWVVVTAMIIVVALTGQADRDTTGKVTDAGSVKATSVKVGDCLPEEVVGREFLSVDVVPCSETHLYEVYANFDLPAGDYPGDEETISLGDEGCHKRFKAFVGVGYDDSKLEYSYLYPIKSSWSVDRGVTCLVTDGKSTGSLEGADR